MMSSAGREFRPAKPWTSGKNAMTQIVSLTPTSKHLSRREHTLSGTGFGTITSAIVLFWAELRRRHRQRITRNILEALDDRTLHDIGIDRSEITSIVKTGAVDHRVNYDHLY
jgi:uncharacterized protein YjiS (DUF1127 family)